MPFHIRPATPADAQAISDANVAMALETEHKALDPAVSLAGVQAAIADAASARYFVAESADTAQVLGQLMVTREWSDWRNAFFWWIMSVYVTPAARGQGIYKSLYRHVEALAKAANACGLRLYTERDNKRAQDVYRKLGMVDTGYLVFEVDWSTSAGQEPK